MDVCALSTINTKPPELFVNLPRDCNSNRNISGTYNVHDKQFITSEIQRLLTDGIIEPSNSPWRAQVVVTKEENHRKRLVIDYSQTINMYTQLDAFPLPRIDDFVNNIASYKVFSSIDLKSAYHQVTLDESDKIYTAFEADGALYQFTRMPSGVTNGVSCFQRIVNDFIAANNLEGTFAYLDNIYVCGHDQIEHDKNLQCFLNAAEQCNWTFNDDKCEFSTHKLNIIGSIVENGTIRPDPERLRPLKELP